MKKYDCHFCGLHFLIGYSSEAKALVCTECGTQHRLREAGWLVFGAGPEFRKVRLEDQALYLRRRAAEKLRCTQRQAALPKEGESSLARRTASLPALRINLLPPRRHYYPHQDQASGRKGVWVTVQSLALFLVLSPVLLCILCWVEIGEWKNRLLPGKKRSDESRTLRAMLAWDHRWRILPVSALTEQKPFSEVLREEMSDWRSIAPAPWEETFRRWLGGVTCGHCGAKGTLRFTWDSPCCPLCQQEPVEVIPVVPFCEVLHR